jgi:TrwC relaxase
MPDPHFHIHAYVLNATFDREENRWKAGLFRDLVANKPYWEASFNVRLAERLVEHGNGIRRTGQNVCCWVNQAPGQKTLKRRQVFQQGVLFGSEFD